MNRDDQFLNAKEKLRRKNVELSEQNKQLAAENVLLKRENLELREQLTQALDRCEALERIAARQAAPFGRRDKDKVPAKDKKKPGRKKGHRGARRPKPRHVDCEVNVSLPACPNCGGPVEDRSPLTQYIEELPLTKPLVTRLTTWKATCPCCGEVRSHDPLQTSYAQGAAGVQLGPRAIALATMLNKQLGIPLRKTCRILQEGFGLSLTAGGLMQILHRVATKAEPQYHALEQQARQSPVNYMDETSWYVTDPQWVLWVATTPNYTLYHVDSSHGGGVADKMIGADYGGVLVTDCHAAYHHFKCAKHKCIAHHLRALSKAREKNKQPTSSYLDGWEQLWKDVLDLRRARDDLPEASYHARRAALEACWQTLLATTVAELGDRKFQTRMRNVGEHHFGCLYHDVEATNNRAERAIRPAVIARKVSCGNRTERGAHTWEILVSVLTTAQQRGLDVLQEISSTISLMPGVLAG